MQYRQLGKWGVRVSEICLGTAFRGQKDDGVCERVIHRAIELGCNFVDCANYYGRGRSETIVGRALKGKRDDIVLTSKVWSRIGPGPNDSGLSRYHIVREAERSLRRLQTDRIDVYLQHHFDADTPSEETLRAMDDLVAQGKVIYAGSCNHPAWRLMEHIGICRAEGLAPLVVTQNPYSLLERHRVEGDLMDVCRKYGLGLMTYSPLAVGLLTGRYHQGTPPPEGSHWASRRESFDLHMDARAQAVVDALAGVGGRRGKTPAQVAVAWILSHPEVTAPIIGPDLPEHVDDAFGATGWALPAEDREALDRASHVEPPRHVA